VTLVIVDVDDTLFDWLGMWSVSFGALLASLEHVSSLSGEQRVAAFRKLHIAARTTERGLTVGDADRLGVPAEIIPALGEEFEASMRRHTRPFSGVVETLAALRQRNVKVVAHTDTPAHLASDRLVQLGLDGVIDTLFATESARVTAFRRTRQTPRHSEVVVLPHLKPDPRGIALILERFGVSSENCVYVGDSKIKDIPMARAAGVRDVFAAYGCKRSSTAYDLLRSVSHWSDEDIARERGLLASEASHELARFDLLLDLI
jgi:phosphoglycolate phosphatase-like HAD superfamily hydrolase